MTARSRRVLVTGGSGFVGRHVVQALRSAGHAVRVLDRVAVPPASVDPEVEVILGDVRDADLCARALRDVDAVCHQAATVGMGLDLQDLPRYTSTNDLGTAVLLAAMDRADVRRLVLASSMVVYGEGRYTCPTDGVVAPGPRLEPDLAAGRYEPPCPVCGAPTVPGLVAEDAPLDPRSVYAVSKVAQEHLATTWARLGGGTVAMLRYHNVFGRGLPRDTPYAGVVSIFRSELLAGRPPLVTEDGAQRRDFVHVTDVARANVAALELPAGTTRAFNVASGTVTTILQLARELARTLGGPEPLVTGRYRLGDVRHVTADATRLAAELGWRPAVALADGLHDLAFETVDPVGAAR